MEGRPPEQVVTPSTSTDQPPAGTPTGQIPSNAQVTDVPEAPISHMEEAASQQLESSRSQNQEATNPDGHAVTWSAAEFTEHSKTAQWYLIVAIITIVAAGSVFLTLHDKITASVIVVAGLAFGIMGARKPRTLNYILDEGGLSIGQKFYGYDLFKSFSILEGTDTPSIYLLPMKRFMPAITIYYEPKDEDNIVNMLSDRLPIEERHVDPVDRLMHRIRF